MWWRNSSQTLFKKIKIEHISGSIFWSFIYFVFIVCRVEGYRNWLKLSRRPLAFISNKVFLKKKRRSGTSLPASFSPLLLKKNISLVILSYLTKFQCLVVSTSWDIGRYVFSHSLLTKLWRNKFWNCPYLSNQVILSTWPKRQDKDLNILRTKRVFRWNKKHFSSLLKGFNWKK